MRAAVLDAPGRPLRVAEVAEPSPGGQLLLRVEACGVCRTDLHLRDGEVEAGHLPLILGHQIVARDPTAGGRRAVAGLDRRDCEYCRSGRENLCVAARFTGKDIDGGYAEWAVADERFCFPLPEDEDPLQLAPLLCGGLIGHRALRLAGDGQRLGLYGFGSAAHIICQVAVHEGRRVFAFTRAGDSRRRSSRARSAPSGRRRDAAGPEPLDAR
jgi:propanol-preferring alcohol dehydrogenase